MNEANVAALEALLAGAEAHVSRTQTAPLLNSAIARMVAERLASRGVLVPSALTDEQAMDVPVPAYLERPSEDAPAIRVYLERIAKGAPA